MTAHSAILGGSNAARLLACPASYHEQLKSTVADVESLYAIEGTMLHEVITFCVKHKLNATQLRDMRPEDWTNWTLTAEQIEILAKALDALEKVKAIFSTRDMDGEPYGKPWRVVGLEVSRPLPGVTGSFGTADLILTNDEVVLIVDWKFGGGVTVRAEYTTPKGELVLNPQLVFYACVGRAAFARAFKGKRIIMAIIQPRLEPALTYAETDNAELDIWADAFKHAVVEAMGRNAHREKGEHCRFAICKSTCPLWTGPVVDLALLDPAKAALRAAAEPARITEYGAFLSRALTLAEIAETWVEEIRRQAHVFLEDGGAVKEWKLVPKRGTRQWIDAAEVPAQLHAIGATDADILTKPELKSVKQCEDSLKKRSLKLPTELYHTISTGTTIARSDDARPESTHAQVITDLRVALKAL